MEAHPLADMVVARTSLAVDVTRAIALAAFNAVAPRDNWKGRIDVVLARSTVRDLGGVEVIREAVIFFTGSVPTIDDLDAGTVRVRAAGYYAAVGA